MSSSRYLPRTIGLLSLICVLLLMVTYNSMPTEVITYPTQIYNTTSISTTQLRGMTAHNSTIKYPDYDENDAIESRFIVNETSRKGTFPAVYNEEKPTPPLLFYHLPEAKVQLTHQPLLIVAYQRTGSSFFNTVLNAHPDVISWYEPLDGMFSKLYGIEQGYTVPVDIYADQYGKDRIPPDFETDYIVDSLESIFSCNYQELPAEVTLHKFNFWSKDRKDDMIKYTTCLKRAGIPETTLSKCRKTHINTLCPKKFGISYENGTRCHRLMEQSDNNMHGSNTTDPQQIAMDKYVKCRNIVHSKASKCIDAIEDVCDKRKVQAVKTVRARMSHAELLLERIPDLKVVHLYRKPAPVMPSRRGLDVLSMYGAKNLVKEAELYCKFLVEDILIERRLADQYPGQVTSYVFQDYTKDTEGTIREVLDFVGLKMDRAVSQSIDSQNLRRKAKLNKSKNKLTGTTRMVGSKRFGAQLKVAAPKKEVVHRDQSKEINSACRNLFELVGDIWPDEQFAYS